MWNMGKVTKPKLFNFVGPINILYIIDLLVLCAPIVVCGGKDSPRAAADLHISVVL